MIPAAQQQPWDQVGAAEAPAQSRHSVTRHGGLPLEAQVLPSNGGWEARLPLRAERVVVQKRVVATERVTVRQGQVTEAVRLNETVAREKLRVDAAGDVELTQNADSLRARPRD